MKYTRDDFWHGRRIKRCVIYGTEIKDARVSDHTENPDRFYICQNSVSGAETRVRNKFGYKYSWMFSIDSLRGLDEIEFYDEPRSIRDVQMGDVVVEGSGGERKVLAKIGNIVALSYVLKFNTVSNWYTIEELEKLDYAIKEGEEPQKRETVVIDGRKYDKQEVEDALKNLEEVE